MKISKMDRFLIDHNLIKISERSKLQFPHTKFSRISLPPEVNLSEDTNLSLTKCQMDGFSNQWDIWHMLLLKKTKKTHLPYATKTPDLQNYDGIRRLSCLVNTETEIRSDPIRVSVCLRYIYVASLIIVYLLYRISI